MATPPMNLTKVPLEETAYTKEAMANQAVDPTRALRALAGHRRRWAIRTVRTIEQVKQAIDSYNAISWSSCGETNIDRSNPQELPFGWVKFAVHKSEAGWRTLEFLAWAIGDMRKAQERIEFTPTAPPPYLNEPGACLSFVIEIFPKDGDHAARFAKVAEFLTWCRTEHWDECKP